MAPSPFEAHARSFLSSRYVYPVLSRRARGISIGINLIPDKTCNFRCVYCQVDPAGPDKEPRVDLTVLREELDAMLDLATSGQLFGQTHFRSTPEPLRRLNDIAFSGDGEPTGSPQFGEAVAVCAEARRRRRLDDLKLVLITNSSLLDRPRVREALAVLDANHGEIWAKLDAGTEAYYRQIARTQVPLERILANLREAARVRPIVVQSLFLRMHGEAPPPAELEAYCQRLGAITAAGGQIKLVQVHTIARPPAENWVAPLSAAEVAAIAELVRQRTGLPVDAF